MKVDQMGVYKMLLNDENEIVFPPIADEIKPVGEALWAVYTGQRIGIINGQGKKVVPFDDYTECSTFSHGLIKLIRANGTYKYFNKLGKLIYVAQYVDYAMDFDGEKISLINYDEDFYTHERQVAQADVYIDSVEKPHPDVAKFLKSSYEEVKSVEDDQNQQNQQSIFNI